MRHILAGAALLALAACTNATTSADIAALESGLTAADDAALGYLQQPVCSATSGPVCSDPTVRAQIKLAASHAYTLVKEAEASNAAGTTSNLTAAESALAAYQAIVTATAKGH